MREIEREKVNFSVQNLTFSHEKNYMMLVHQDYIVTWRGYVLYLATFF